MRNWKLLAAALEANIPEGDLERIEPALNALEAQFRPLASAIPIDTDPALVFACSPEDPA